MLLVILSFSAHASNTIAKPSSLEAEDSVHVELLQFRGHDGDSLRVDVYVALPLHLLRFVQKGQGWAARYSVRVDLNVNALDLPPWESGLQTLSRSTKPALRAGAERLLHQACFSTVPGPAALLVVVRDDLSGREWRTVRQVQLHSYPTLPALSSVMILSAVEQRAERTLISPYIGDNVAVFDKGFFVFFECYAPEGLDSASVRVCILDNNEELWSSPVHSILLGVPRSQHYVDVALPADLDNGWYTLRVELRDAQAKQQHVHFQTRSEKRIEVNDPMRLLQSLEVDAVIDQLRYVATQAELDSMRALPDPRYRRQALNVFWLNRDPTPGTLRNEARDEYNRRIADAAKNYENNGDGWLSDRGMVSIILGPPTEQHQETSNDGRSYIVWTYDHPARKFVFIDDGNFGSYKLSTTTPFSSSQKYQYRAQ